jgi:hypothetical protein
MRTNFLQKEEAGGEFGKKEETHTCATHLLN